MLDKFYIENFRGIEKREIDLGRITVLTGANNSGKTSVIYALLTLKNFISNPNQSIDNILVPAQTNLGGFRETVYKKEENRNIKLAYDFSWNILSERNESGAGNSYYELSLGKTQSSIRLNCFKPYKFELKNTIAFPYPLNKNEIFTIDADNNVVDVTWNGVSVLSVTQSQKRNVYSENKILDNTLKESITLIINGTSGLLGVVDYVPLKRGFTKPYFNTIPLTGQQYTEDEIATLLATNRDLEGKVSAYLERFINKTFQVRTTLGTSNFYLQVRDRKNGFVTDLVNEGLGVNQLVTILTKVLKNEIGILCIDEPEIHLHPSYIDILAEIIVELATPSKQFILSTHSEHLVSALLNKVGEQKLRPEDLKVYYLTKDHLKTNFELQGVNDKGQIEGGLKSFYENELKTSKDFFKVNP